MMVVMQFHARLADGRVVQSVATKGVLDTTTRGVGFGDGGEVPAGDARVERLPSGPHIARDAVVFMLGQWYKVAGHAGHPPFGVQSWIELVLMEAAPEEAQVWAFGDQLVTFKGEELAL